MDSTVRPDRSKGSLCSFEEFYEQYYRQLVGVLTSSIADRAEAEDVAQEAFMRLLARWDRVVEYERPLAWVTTVAFRLSISRWRRARVAVKALPRMLSDSTVAAAPDESRVYLAEVLRHLNREHREVLVLRLGLDLSEDETARVLQVPVGTVKSRLARARASAQKVMEEES